MWTSRPVIASARPLTWLRAHCRLQSPGSAGTSRGIRSAHGPEPFNRIKSSPDQIVRERSERTEASSVAPSTTPIRCVSVRS